MTSRDLLLQAGWTPVKCLGRGGTGDLYEAVRLEIDRSCAIRVIPMHFLAAGPEERRAAVRRRLDELLALQHAHIVSVQAFELMHDACSIQTDLAPGDGRGSTSLQDLADYHKGILEPETLIELMTGVLAGVAHAHQSGMVHGMLKPSNILLYRLPDRRLVARVADFGIKDVCGEQAIVRKIRAAVMVSVKKQIPDDHRGDTLRRLVTTWQYWSPEQQAGRRADTRSDVFSLGLICYRLITGRKLSPRPPSYYNSRLSAEYDGFILKALDSDPSQRYADAAAMQEALAPVRELVVRRVRERRAAETDQQIAESRARAEEFAADQKYDDALEVLQALMEQYPGRQDIIQDFSAIEDMRHQDTDAARRDEDYHWELQEALKLEAAGDLDGAYQVWRNLENLCPDKPEPPARLDDLKRKISERDQAQLRDDLVKAQQDEVDNGHYRDIVEYRRLRSEVWDAVESGHFSHAMDILNSLREQFKDSQDLLDEIDVIEAETLEARRADGSARLTRWVTMAGALLLTGMIITALFLWLR